MYNHPKPHTNPMKTTTNNTKLHMTDNQQDGNMSNENSKILPRKSATNHNKMQQNHPVILTTKIQLYIQQITMQENYHIRPVNHLLAFDFSLLTLQSILFHIPRCSTEISPLLVNFVSLAYKRLEN